MAKKTQKRHARPERNDAGCMSGLISIFDFRQGHSTQKLLSDRKHGSARHAGTRNSEGKFNTSISSEDKPRSVHNAGDDDGAFNSSTSVKILIEEEMSNVRRPKKNPRAGAGPKKPIEASYEKTREKKSEDSVLPDLNNAESLYHNIHLAGVLEDICGDKQKCQRLLQELKRLIDSCPSRESANKVASDFLHQPDLQQAQDHPTLRKVLIETAEALMNQDVEATSNKSPCSSGELISALKMVNSQELLLKILRDQGSHLIKHVEEIEIDNDGNLSETKSRKLLQPKVSPELCEDSISHKTSQKQNMHRLFRKKEKSKEAKASSRGDDGKKISKIVVLKPTPPRGQDSADAISMNPSPSFDSLRETENGRVVSHFSFKEIKRRFKNAIGDHGKGHDILPVDGVLHRIPHQKQLQVGYDRRLDESGQAKPISNSSHHKEKSIQRPPVSKKKDKKLKLKEIQPSIAYEGLVQDKNLCISTTTSLHRECNFQREARKHLADMFNSVDSEANLPSAKKSEPLGRMLSLSEYNVLSPRLNPGWQKESCPSPRHMRFSPFWQLKQEAGIVELTSICSSRTLQQVSETDMNAQEQGNSVSGEISALDNLSNEEISNSTGCELVEQWEGEHGQERNISHAPFELSVDGHSDAVERSDEEQFSLSPRAETLEIVEIATMSIPSTPTTLLVDDIGSPGRTIDKPDRPSPVSVLESLFFEDDSNLITNTEVHVEIQAQPRPIYFEEDDNSVIVLTTTYNESSQNTTCLEDKKCRSEYVKAVLEASGLLQDLLSDRWYSSPLLSPSLYDEVEYSSDEFPDDLRLLFDSIDENLEVIHNKLFGRTPWVSLAKAGVQSIPSKEDLIKQVWKGVDRHFLVQETQTLEKIVGNDMETMPWMDLRSGIDSIGLDLADAILRDMLEDIIVELWVEV